MHEIRKRANAAESASYTLTDIRDEWAREFWFEGRRRIDLIRFGDFGGHTDYNWDWKGGEKQGTEIKKSSATFILFLPMISMRIQIWIRIPSIKSDRSYTFK